MGRLGLKWPAPAQSSHRQDLLAHTRASSPAVVEAVGWLGLKWPAVLAPAPATSDTLVVETAGRLGVLAQAAPVVEAACRLGLKVPAPARALGWSSSNTGPYWPHENVFINLGGMNAR